MLLAIGNMFWVCDFLNRNLLGVFSFRWLRGDIIYMGLLYLGNSKGKLPKKYADYIINKSYTKI